MACYPETFAGMIVSLRIFSAALLSVLPLCYTSASEEALVSHTGVSKLRTDGFAGFVPENCSLDNPDTGLMAFACVHPCTFACQTGAGLFSEENFPASLNLSGDYRLK